MPQGIRGVTPIDPRSVISTQGVNVPTQLTDAYQHMEKFNQEADQQRRAEAKDQVTAFEQMAKNPQMAPQIAQAYGMDYTPEIDTMLKNKQATALTVGGMKAIKELGINDYEQARVFMDGYVQSGGNVQQAISTLEGRIGKSTQNAPSTSGLPQGYMWDQNTGQPTQIPGITPDMYPARAGQKWHQNPKLPPHLQIQGAMLEKSMGSGFKDLDSEDVQAYMKAIEPYMTEGIEAKPEVPFFDGSPNIEDPVYSNASQLADSPEDQFMKYDPQQKVYLFTRPDGSVYGKKHMNDR